MSAHVHAENMRLYAEDALETSEPWKRWQRWNAFLGCWVNLEAACGWSPNILYCRKPKTIKVIVGDRVIKFNEPLKKLPPRNDTPIWVIHVGSLSNVLAWCTGYFSDGSTSINDYYIHLTEESAKAHSEALKIVMGI